VGKAEVVAELTLALPVALALALPVGIFHHHPELEDVVHLVLALPVGVASGLEVVVSAAAAEDVLEVQGVVAEPSVEVA